VTRGEAWLQHVSNLLVGGTGLVYAWMRYALEPDDPYAVVNHPLEREVQHLHLLVAPLLVFAVALVWQRHVWARVRSDFPARRATGLALAASFAPMVASGYLLQTADGETWRTAWLVVHLSTSGLWLLAMGVHLLSPRPQTD
jgi:predicted metal-binding membrane protein